MPVPPRPSSNDQAPPVYPEAAPSREESQTRRMASNPHPQVEPEPEAPAGTLSVQVTFDDDGNEVLEPPLPLRFAHAPPPAPPPAPAPALKPALQSAPALQPAPAPAAPPPTSVIPAVPQSYAEG